MHKYICQFRGRSCVVWPSYQATPRLFLGDSWTLFAGTHLVQANRKTPVSFGQAAGGYPLTVSATAARQQRLTTTGSCSLLDGRKITTLAGAILIGLIIT